MWVAHNEALDIHVAVKFIRGDLRHPQLSDRLLQEARAAARIGHPAIVRVTDFGKTKPGHPFIVMELLGGEDLGTLLDRDGRMDAVQAVRTLLPIIDALAAVHDQGIVHRDLKPENIFLTRGHDGVIRPKLVDFGIAKFENDDFKRLTDFGVAVGSPGYMSPEQARGEDVDGRSDVWALCVVLYELVTGELPFDGDSYNALLRAVIELEARPIVELEAGDAGLWAVLERGFVKSREGRWQSMRDLGTALADWLSQRGYSEDITGSSLQAWLEPRSSQHEDLLAAPPPSGTPPLVRLSKDLETLQPAAGDPPPVSSLAASTSEDVDPPGVGAPRRALSPMSTVAIAALVGCVLAVGAFALSSREPQQAATPAAPAKATAAAATESAGAPQASSAPAPPAVPSPRARPADSAAPEAAPEAGPTTSASARPSPRPRRHYAPRPHKSHGLDIKTTL